MTQEEKAKAYDEALERFHQFKEKYYRKETHFGDVLFDKTGEMQKEFNNIFHELQESEDERIRKELIGMIKECTNWAHKKEYIAYLERQKENPKTADSIPSDCTSDAKYDDRWHKVSDSLPDNTREVLCKDAIGNYFIGRYYSKGIWEVSMYDDCDKSNEDNPPVVMWIDIPSEKQKDLDKMIVVSPEVWDKAIADAYENGRKDSEKQKEQNEIPLMNGDSDLYFDNWIQHNDTTKRGYFEEGIRYAQRLQKELDYLNKFTKLPHLNSDYEVVDDWAYTPSLCHCDGNWAVCWIHCEDGDVLHECVGDTPAEAIDKAVEWFTSLGKQIPVKKVGAIISSRDKEETACGYLERCLTPDMRRVWYEACDELKKACFQEAEKQKKQKPRINIGQLKSLMLQYLQEAANEKDDSDIEADTDKWARKILGYDFEQKPANDKAFEEWIDDWWKHNKVNNPDSYDKGDELQFDEKGFKNFCRGIRNMYAEQKPAEQEIIELTDFENKIKDLLAEKCEIHYNENLGGCYELKELCKNILKLAYSQLQAELKQDIFEAKQEGRREGYEAAKNELKPAEWSEEDKKMLLSIINAFRNGTVSTIGQEQWLKSLPERFNLQPKQEWSDTNKLVFKDICKHLKEEGYNGWVTLLEALHRGEFKQPVSEWSEEDEIKLASLINYFEGDALDCSTEEIIAWLKSLPLNLKKKNEDVAKLCSNEWGKEDEKILDNLIRFYSREDSTFAWRWSDGTITYGDVVNFLKSLRPQPHTVSIKDATKFGNLEYERGVKDGIQSEKSRQWKPSEEQMQALDKAIPVCMGVVGHDEIMPLESLYKQLKKLM